MFARFRLRVIEFTRGVARVTTAVLLTIGLTVLYFLGIGFTRVLMSLFARSELATPPTRESFWIEATNEEPTMENATGQS